MPDTDTILQVRVGALALRSPLLAAPGTCGFGEELERIGVTAALGARVTKTVTREPREGNPPTRIAEKPAGMLNAIGLQNPGIDAVIADKLPTLSRFDTAFIVNISGRTVDEYGVTFVEPGLCLFVPGAREEVTERDRKAPFSTTPLVGGKRFAREFAEQELSTEQLDFLPVGDPLSQGDDFRVSDFRISIGMD